MPYADFTLESFETTFGLIAQPAELFPGLAAVPIPTWLQETLARGRDVAALVSEKARSEFLVAPVLLAVRELVPGELAIFSGQRLDVDLARGLMGECDYILRERRRCRGFERRWRSSLKRKRVTSRLASVNAPPR